MNAQWRKVISYLFTVLVLGCIGFLVFVTQEAKQNPNEIPTFFGYKPMTVLTNSMLPNISAGDMVFVKQNDYSSIKKGDIISFKVSDDRIVTHRVLRVTKEGFLTKGDNNNVKDNWLVKPDSLVGEVALTIPKAGYISKFVSSKIGFGLFIILPLFLLVLIEVYQRVLAALDKRENEAVTKA
ncbi:signal peptidase I [Neobacillus sp. PS3-34]|uniref:signal peptidase I n=1 Tax=Neobacillus sp. PS3-34 TaxID=3070678 RepID=UPI0027E116B6|nr:signal peptidase I [Neobacillus sp. PS3-34]WML46662.1 signal peptidase I [Neobacillus sp. PS3-34]